MSKLFCEKEVLYGKEKTGSDLKYLVEDLLALAICVTAYFLILS